MGFFDSIFGVSPAVSPSRGAPASADEQAIARYRYLLRTAPPEAIEQAHAEAFAQLTDEQRAQVLRQVTAQLPASEQTTGSDPQSLARVATRAEMARPGILERSLGAGGGPGFGSMMLSSIAGTVIGSSIAHALFGGFHSSPEAAESGQAGDAHADAGDASDDVGGGDDFDGGDFGDV